MAGNYGGGVNTRTTWKSAKPDGGINAGTLFHLAREVGWRDPANDAAPRVPAVRPAEPKPSGPSPQAIWNAYEPANEQHPYIVRKGGAPDGLRGYRGDLVIAHERMDGWLVIPVRDAAGELVTLQFIAPGKRKLNLPRYSVTGWHVVGELRPGAKVYIVEGIGQAWSAHQVTGDAAAVAFGDGNMERVARAMRDAGAVPVIVPDGGKEAQAEKRARAVGCAWVKLPADLPDNDDINDIQHREGREAVLAVLENEQLQAVNDNATAIASPAGVEIDADAAMMAGEISEDALALIFESSHAN